MKYLIETSIEINASIEKVWSTFKDFENHSIWNKTLHIHHEHLEVNKAFKVDFMNNGKVAMTFKPKLLKDESNHAFEWLGHAMIPGLFDGHHKFHLVKLDENRTKFIQSEHFSGILVRPLLKSVIIPTKSNFEILNDSFKSYVEAI